ncbi:hypothetical protein J3R82DRAFT_4183 [Butyriboletus roseoflavus]|nr:hypothetical protein J3R82DRAFT_4183 [Butyriboletus roseoflavus]
MRPAKIASRPHTCETLWEEFCTVLRSEDTLECPVRDSKIDYLYVVLIKRVSSKAKPFICGIGTCTKAFGDPSSRTRHRKETHRREGAYKCIITDCGTRIKRRSAFVAHLRKHGLDPNSLDLDAIVLQSSGSGIPAPAHFASPVVEDNSHHKVAPLRSELPADYLKGSGYCTLRNSGEANYFMDNNGWSDDDPLDCRRAKWFPANDALLLGSESMLDQTLSVGPSGIPHDIYPDLSSDFKNPFCFDGIFPTTVDYPLFVSPLNLSVLEPFPEAESDGSQASSSSSSPSSTYSALYTTDFNDVASLSLASNASQESLLYNII